MGWSRSGSPYPNGCAMKSATIKYLQSSASIVSDILDSGKRSDLFGSGSEDVVLNTSGVFTELVNSYTVSGTLEYRNVTINEGVDIVGTSQIDSNNNGTPFYLKVNGTLTVNGHLHMDNMGGSWTRSTSAKRPTYSEVGLNYPFLFEKNIKYDTNNYTLSTNQYLQLKNYGEKNPFFNCKIGLTGAGCAYKTHEHKHHNNYGHGQWCGSTLNSGGIAHQGKSKGKAEYKYNYRGSGGGFLALYYETMSNKYAKTFDIGDGVEVPLNIHSNSSWYLGTTAFRGGGMMVIAAKNIVIGRNGSITCDGGANPNGACGFMNCTPNTNPNWNSTAIVSQVIYNGGNPYITTNLDYHYNFSGGAGVCFGYQVDPSYGGSI